MRRTEIDNFGEFWRDSVEFLEDFVRDNNPELFNNIKWILDEEPWVLVLYNSSIPILEWTPMSDQQLMQASGLSHTQLQIFKRNANDSIKATWGLPNPAS